jgi:MSHA biogenesis protein MshM
LLCRRFLATLSDEQVVAYLPNPMLEPRILLIAIAEELGLKLQGLDYQFHLLKQFNEHLLEMAAQGKKVVICIDEAQSMPLESLEALRLLSNLETEKSKLLQVVMFGQPELDQKLANPAVRQLRQRIVFHYRMPGLKQQESAHYLAHRLRVAGHRDGDVFPPSSARLLYRLSSGTPRLVNVLAHKAMLLAYGEGKPRVSRKHVVLAGRDTEGLRPLHWWQRW